MAAASEKIDFANPALIGDIVEVTGRVARVGNSSLDVEVELMAEAPVSGERRLCTRGRFTLVAVKGPGSRLPLPKLIDGPEQPSDGRLRMVNIVFPGQTNHHATLYGGDALKLMDQAAFVAATRDARAIMVTAAIDHVDFTSPIHEGELVEMVSRVRMRGRTSMRVEVELWAEHLLSGVRRHAATAMFTMVSVDAAGRPHPFRITAAS